MPGVAPGVGAVSVPVSAQHVGARTLSHTMLQEIKAGDAARTRSLFERAITLQLPPKKMKVRGVGVST